MERDLQEVTNTLGYDIALEAAAHSYDDYLMGLDNGLVPNNDRQR